MNAASNGRLTHLASWNGASIGRYTDGTINTRFNGWMAELIIYNRALSESERKTVESYLNLKYNLGISVDSKSPHHHTDILNPILSVRTDKTTDSKTSGGLTIDGSFISGSSSIYTGHNNATGLTNAFNPSQALYPNFQRLERQWFLDIRGTLNTVFKFDLDALGLDGINPSGNNYRLLYRQCTCQNYSIIDVQPSINGTVISFSVPSRTETTHNGFYTMGTLDSSISTLPVTLSSFTGSATAIGSQLRWTTAAEQNLLGFYIYRSEAYDFASARRISDIIPATNTSNTQVYSFTDREIQAEIGYYYWLFVMEYNGLSNTFGPVNVIHSIIDNPPPVPILAGIISTYPNPFNPLVNISYAITEPAETEVSIYNQVGQRVWYRNLGSTAIGIYNLEWNATGNTSGRYILRFKSGNLMQTKIITLSK